MSIDQKAFAKAAEVVVDFRSKNGTHFSWEHFQLFLETYESAKVPLIDIEVGAIACSQWVYGSNHGKPSWDRLSEEHRNEYREQAKACARAWGMKYGD